MHTSKPIATISYNTHGFLIDTLMHLRDNGVISDWFCIKHFHEEDESKDHYHVWVKPNGRLDTLSLQNCFKEFDPKNPDKPLGCIDFEMSDPDNAILYFQHLKSYLESKGQTRKYSYLREDFYYADEMNFENLYNHAFKSSKWAQDVQILEQLRLNKNNPASLIENNIIKMNQACQLNAYMNMCYKYNEHTFRNGKKGHK